jgi:hypothetical protein
MALTVTDREDNNGSYELIPGEGLPREEAI